MKKITFAIVALGHLVMLIFFRINLATEFAEIDREAKIMKLVDVEEFIPPPPAEPEEEMVIKDQPKASEEIIEVEKKVIESVDGIPTTHIIQEPEYLPQHKISQIPILPSEEIQKRIVYPPLALRQKLQAVVFLELYIDQNGLIRKVVVLKDPGNGFAEAAVEALEGTYCTPAYANGNAVAVRFRYPVRFALN